VDNENTGRFGSLLDAAQQKALQVLHLLLPGTPIVYYGDEIAMKNGVISGADVKDPLAQISVSLLLIILNIVLSLRLCTILKSNKTN